jgi:hypothetical protein
MPPKPQQVIFTMPDLDFYHLTAHVNHATLNFDITSLFGCSGAAGCSLTAGFVNSVAANSFARNPLRFLPCYELIRHLTPK